MPRTSKIRLSADEIAGKALRGEDISAYFNGRLTAVRPVRRGNVDPQPGQARELEERATRLNISRQAVIKALLDRALQEGRPGKLRPRKKVG